MASQKQMKREYLNPKVKGSFLGLHGFYKNTHKYTKSQIKEVLSTIPTYALHKPALKKYPRRVVYIPGIREQFVADLIELKRYAKVNNNTNYLLTCMDGFSKFAYVVPCKGKDTHSVINAFKKIFKSCGKLPKRLQNDRGKEFMNNEFQEFMKSLKIKHFPTGSDLKCILIERFNRTLMTRIARYMTHTRQNKYIHVLKDIVGNYNRN